MNIKNSHAAVAAIAFLAFGVVAGRTVFAEDDASKAVAASLQAATDTEEAGADDAIADAEESLEQLEREYDAAMDDLNYGPDPSYSVSDPELQMGQRQAVELNEMICAQTGQNCEAAAMARRHYEEKYGPM